MPSKRCDSVRCTTLHVPCGAQPDTSKLNSAFFGPFDVQSSENRRDIRAPTRPFVVPPRAFTRTLVRAFHTVPSRVRARTRIFESRHVAHFQADGHDRMGYVRCHCPVRWNSTAHACTAVRRRGVMLDYDVRAAAGAPPHVVHVRRDLGRRRLPPVHTVPHVATRVRTDTCPGTRYESRPRTVRGRARRAASTTRWGVCAAASDPSSHQCARTCEGGCHNPTATPTSGSSTLDWGGARLGTDSGLGTRDAHSAGVQGRPSAGHGVGGTRRTHFASGGGARERHPCARMTTQGCIRRRGGASGTRA